MDFNAHFFYYFSNHLMMHLLFHLIFSFIGHEQGVDIVKEYDKKKSLILMLL